MRARLISCLMVLFLVTQASADLVGCWKLNDGAGTKAADSSGNGHHGTLISGPQWAAGYYGGALQFNGQNSYVEIPTAPQLEIRGQVTVAAWVNWANAGDTWLAILANGQQNGPWENYGLFVNRSSRFAYFTLSLNDAHVNQQTANNTIEAGRWQHLCGTWDGTAARIYVDGKLLLTQARTGALTSPRMPLRLGHRNGSVHYYSGLLDEVAVFDHALTAEEIQKAMLGIAPPELAADPQPGDGAVDVPRDATLGWTPGRLAATHDVYFGTTRADVNAAGRTDPKGVLAGQGQTEATFDPPGLLAYGQTYSWRVDEVNRAPDNTIFKGEVWSFTAEPYSYPVKPVKATASSYQMNMGPEKTIDGSGLTGDLHGTEPTTMWLSAGVPPNWIQYEFDKVYLLHQLMVWNSNQLIESFLGFGARKVTVETSLDGVTWTAVADGPEFSRAAGAPGYAANTTVKFGGVEAKFVKLTINSNWSGTVPPTGLAEVRFFYVPVQARSPQPAAGAKGVSVETDLNWRPGRQAAAHEVFFGTDPNALPPAQRVTDHRFTPGALTFGTTYYWKVNEVNAVTYPGDLWSFTTQEYQVIDDFESYTDDEGSRIYQTWIDGWTNGTGAVVGYLQAPFGERTILHGGKQSLPFEYNNVKTPHYSEAERTFDSPQDWTTHGADTLSLYLRGYGVGFADRGNNAFSVTSTGSDIWGNADQFRFVYRQLSGNGSMTARVDSLIRSDAWSKAGVMIRETLEAGSKHAATVVTPDNGVSFPSRNASNSASVQTNVTALKAPYWVRVTRTGNAFKSECSPDGKTWTQVGTNLDITMGANIYVGLCLTSHNVAAYSTAEFSNVATTGTVTGAWQSLSIGVTQRANDPAPLYVVVEDKAGKKQTVIHPDPAAAATAAWTEWRIPLSDLATVNLAAVKKLTLGVGDKASPKAGGGGILYIDDIGFGHPAK